VIAYTVARRTSEIGLRIALGASHGNVLWLVLREAGLLTLAESLSACLWRWRSAPGSISVIRLTATDPITYAGGAVLLAAIALLAGYLPGRRAPASIRSFP